MNVEYCIRNLISQFCCEHAVVSPGSRNAPVLYALNKLGIECHSIIDERSAAFVALGIAKETRRPVILSCTSGTAALNYGTAIAEAYYARVPLIILTADRPAEKIDQWDGQAIQQNGMYRNFIRAEFNTIDNYVDIAAFKELGSQIYEFMESNIPGPVHVNIPIREPFYNFSETEVINATRDKPDLSEKFIVSLQSLSSQVNVSFIRKKILVFHGMTDGENIEFDHEGSSVCLADITSQKQGNVFYWDAMLFVEQSKKDIGNMLKDLKPDVLVTTGTTTVSKGLKRFLHYYKPEHHFHISNFTEVGDMFQTDPQIISPDNLLKNKKEVKVDDFGSEAFLDNWRKWTTDFENRFSALEWSSFSDFTVVNFMLDRLPQDAIIHVSSSMPVRYASFLMNKIVSQHRIYGNRGTSGIDGSTSTAVGNALATDNDVYIITGDLAFFYDMNALFNMKLPQNLKIVILNNQSGGIFELINGPEKMGDAIQYQTTPHLYECSKLSEHFGIEYRTAYNIQELAQGFEDLKRIEGPVIFEIKTSSKENGLFFQTFKAL